MQFNIYFFSRINYHMNMIIKLEEEYPLSSPDYDPAFFNHCLTTFYDQDSNEIIENKCSVQDVICYLEHTIDICDTPLNEIMMLVSSNQIFRGADHNLVRRKIIKQKNLLKRNRAKNREAFAKEKRQIIDVALVTDSQEEEYKKQRNRISAQISRDKKKEKVKALEQLNQQLQEECSRQKLQNEQLRQQIQNNSQREFKNGDVMKSKFTKLLILLGIIFLFGLIRDIFGSDTTQVTPLTKINPIKTTSYSIKTQPFFAGKSGEEKSRILDSIEESLTEVVEKRSMITRIKQKLGKEMRIWSDQPWWLTAKAKQELRQIKDSVMM